MTLMAEILFLFGVAQSASVTDSAVLVLKGAQMYLQM